MKGRESVNPILGRICITNNILKGHNKTGRVISTDTKYAAKAAWLCRGQGEDESFLSDYLREVNPLIQSE